MALKSTIYKLELSIADMDRGYYATHALTLARHPSETEERVMVRVLAFAMYASEHLQFARGLSDTEEPDLWEKDYTASIRTWIEVGQPDERRVLKAMGRAEQVCVLCYASTVDVWWKAFSARVREARGVRIVRVPAEQSAALAEMAQRSLQLQCTIQDGQIWMNDGHTSLLLEPVDLKALS